jgi:hypothetical protein
MNETTAVTEISFRDFVFRDKLNQRYFYFAIIGSVIQFVVFKQLYPSADYFQDSYSFLENARKLDGFAIWPIGYSRFLYGVHLITHSDTAVVGLQYLLQTGAVLLLFFTVRYWHPFGASASTPLFIVLFFTPLSLYISNYIASDSLFVTLSLLWFTQLLWIIHRPRTWYIWTHALVLFLAFTVRYQAMYYPLISLAAFVISRYPLKIKLIGVALPAIFVASFVIWTRAQAYALTGVPLFTVQSGWNLASNAMYMYPYIDVDSSKIPAEARTVGRMTRIYFDTVPAHLKEISPRVVRGFYLATGPLKDYSMLYHKAHPESTMLDDWTAAAPTLATFGKHLILQHPVAYTQYFILPNTLQYFIPPEEYLDLFNQGRTRVDPAAKEWFDLETADVKPASWALQGYLFSGYARLFLIVCLAFPAGFIWFIRQGKTKTDPVTLRSMTLVSVLWLTVLGFSVLAGPITLRYLIFPLLVFILFSTLLLLLWMQSEDTTPAS